MGSKATTPKRSDVLRVAYREARADLNKARKAQTWHALARMRSQVLEIHEQLMAVEAAEAEEAAADLSPEELEAELVATLTELPRDMVRRIVDQVLPTKLHVVG